VIVDQANKINLKMDDEAFPSDDDVRLHQSATVDRQSKCESLFHSDSSDDEIQDEDMPPSMICVPHLSKKYTDDKSNLPVWEFTVHNGDDCKFYCHSSIIRL
jgi:hypothetical protein